MASPPNKLKIEENGSRLSKLLINKGTQGLKTTLQLNFNNFSSSLITELNDSSTMNKLTLLKKKKVINEMQWDLLYPSTGLPNLENFEISLLTVLLRNICGLTAPHGGWDSLPSSSDSSTSANIARIKFYRNKVYGHITTTSVDDSTFEYLWQEISKALVVLGIQQTEIDELKKAPLSPDEANYIEMLKEWYKEERQLIKVVEKVEEIKEIMSTKNDVAEIKQEMATKADVVGIREIIQGKISSDLKKLGKCKFNGLIKDLNKKYLEGTRQWLFENLDTWFNDRSEDASNVMILIAGPGVGKSVFAAELCRRYSEKRKLAACHFCRYNRSDERNPRILIESLACSMCDTLLDFKSKLNEELQRNHSKDSITDAFRVLLNNPLHSLEDHEPMLLVIDALDESEVDGKSELLELIAEEFDRLPKWIKIFITSRPELPVQKELKDMNPVEIKTKPRDENNEEDLHKYLRHQLNDRVQKNRYLLQSLVKKCEGSFLYAYHAQLSLNKEEIELTYENIQQLVPSGLGSVYKKQFKRVKELLTEKSLSTGNSVISKIIFKQFLELLAACREVLPLTLLFSYLGISDDIKFEVCNKILELLSQILPVYDDCLTVYHKSLIDWLKSDGYEQHEFTVSPKNGHKFLWHACEKVFKHIKSMNIFEDQMNTAMIKYALKNGIYHLSKCGENVDFSWAVDIKVVFARLMCVEDINGITIRCELSEIIKELLTFLRKDVLEEPLFDFFTTMKLLSSTLHRALIFLQTIADRIHVSNEERFLAMDLLKQGKVVWFENLDSTFLTNRHHLTLSLPANVTSLCVSSNEELFAVGYENGQISIFELPEFKQRCTLGTALDDSRLDKWDDVDDVDTLMSPYDNYDYPRITRNRGIVCCCSFSPTGNRLVTSDGSPEVKLWDVNNGRLLLCLQSDDVVNLCSFLDSGLFITAEYVERTRDNDLAIKMFTAWNSLTLQRIDRRCVVDYKKLQCTDKCSESFVAEFVETSHVFQFPKAIDIFSSKEKYLPPLHLMITHHYRDCIFYHTSQNGKLSEITQLTKYNDQAEIVFCLPYVRCPCVDRAFDKVHPMSFKEFYVLPYFSKLKIFKTDHLWRPSFIFEKFKIKCCCFSPDGSFFAAFAVGDHVNIHIWSIERCTIIQIIPMQLKNAKGCWWSEGLLWIWDGSDHLMKISTSSERFVDSTQTKRVFLGFRPRKILTFGDVLVCINEEKFVQVVRITKGKIQYNKRLPVDSSKFIATAVFPDNSVILTVNKTEYTLWKWGNNNNVLYLKPWHTAEIPITALIEKFVPQHVTVDDLKINCCIRDSKQAVITFCKGNESMVIYVINVHENGYVNSILHDVRDNYFKSNVIVHKSYCIGVFDWTLFAVDLKSGEECAEFYEHYYKSNITMHSNTGTLAIVESLKYRKLHIDVDGRKDDYLFPSTYFYRRSILILPGNL
ncbi:uncharacterized protein LOC124451508 [Xenia sp. Carnegie-2017]|uniref:uncharacterized protein LOC124451508 n=1 Tax=Xenia sp. Carnegie-2017 TaxID=2897299 RepID=UPI001F04BF6D|nr:uncharacterized protein LOC124451508 [Xenia sp. Carnegie-2017]XP_046858114.1 uncharacterized protein LOC124451508 [Xenia sp. Carnegie-2017]XP_046858115.1 uncharacterized protein LOC124451508 [Xenia sp. Carnegie-2017]XP_046858116.1 uncharacterized protein LOC124451508 [Xenia sp. Carnegie-2017]XP_046858117.1 uncharacterized protein LOC124451508 [Xenia sp. Carnegie-2017]XP_046858118.1 uncharacterized protein LOC124451508 [Xenia sp. Carnegie-2017]XP_046858119.1 uncharacterized protein LOC12445